MDGNNGNLDDWMKKEIELNPCNIDTKKYLQSIHCPGTQWQVLEGPGSKTSTADGSMRMVGFGGNGMTIARAIL